jgi:hypothetical protein
MRCDGIEIRQQAADDTYQGFAVVCKHCCDVVCVQEYYTFEYVPLSVHGTVEEAENVANDHWLTHHFIESLDWPGIVTEVRSRQANVEDLIGSDD